MADTFHILQKVVEEAKYKPGWTMRLQQTEDGLRLILTDRKCVDAYNPTQSMPLSHFHAVPKTTFNEASWRRWVFEQCRRTENHEIGEWLRWGDERPFAPLHGPGEDPYTVHEFRLEQDSRVKQDGSMR